ncbi:MarC family protein [Longispora albida]|uniref:MarC family protein n=1 Tax=Longispora albida TaxID=203523 RepID=UPI0003737847|nr:MarC family protein [Longispora albida]
MDFKLFGAVFLTLIVITDPPGLVPIFLALTSSMDARHRRRAALQSVLLSFGVIVTFAVIGEQIFKYLHIELFALRAAGGLLLLLVALELLTGKSDDPSREVTSNVALVPLGTPLLAGPGAIVATMLFVRGADDAGGYLAIAGAIVVIHVIIFLVLRYSGIIVRLLKPSGIEVLTRIAGLLLAAIAVQMIADAIVTYVKEYF